MEKDYVRKRTIWATIGLILLVIISLLFVVGSFFDYDDIIKTERKLELMTFGLMGDSFKSEINKMIVVVLIQGLLAFGLFISTLCVFKWDKNAFIIMILIGIVLGIWGAWQVHPMRGFIIWGFTGLAVGLMLIKQKGSKYSPFDIIISSRLNVPPQENLECEPRIFHSVDQHPETSCELSTPTTIINNESEISTDENAAASALNYTTAIENGAEGIVNFCAYEENSGSNNKFKIWIICAAAAVILLIGGFVGYKCYYVPYATDRDALRTYVVADNLFLRSSKIAGVEHNILTKVTYGTELITYEKDDEWANVKLGQTVGYVASPYLVDAQDFNVLAEMWGDADARTCVESNKCRFAVLDYFKRGDLTSGTEGWQIYTKGKDVKPNNVAFPRLYNANSKFTDFLFIIKNNVSNERILAAYSFEDETERPIFRFDYLLPMEYGNASIKSAKSVNGKTLLTFDNNETITVEFD